MSIAPDEISHVDLRRAWLRGYRRKDVPSSSTRPPIASRRSGASALTFPGAWRSFEAELARHLELETLLRSTLVSAERAGQEMKAQARREADLVVQDAHAEARRLTREAVAEKRRLEGDVIKIRAQLMAAFETLGEWPPSVSATKRDEAAPTTQPCRSARPWRAAFADRRLRPRSLGARPHRQPRTAPNANVPTSKRRRPRASGGGGRGRFHCGLSLRVTPRRAVPLSSCRSRVMLRRLSARTR